MLELKKEEVKEIKKTISDIEKAFGKGSIMLLGEEADKKIESISSGSLLLDKALGVGGYPKGRIIEIFGPESSGKTTLSLHAIAQAQKTGGIVAFIDAEHSLDVNYASKLGVDIDNLLLSQPDTGEQALEIVEQLIKSKLISMIVIDSVAALVPEAEIMGEMGDSHMGLQARLMSQAMRKLSGVINKTNTTVIFINQVREKIGVVYGNPETTPGGRALKFYSSVRLDVRKQEIIKNNDEFLGTKVAIKVVKNKVAPPFKSCVVEMLFGKGISKETEIIDLSVEYNIIQKSGSWYSYNENKIGQGKEQVKNFFIQNPLIYKEIEEKILEIISK